MNKVELVGRLASEPKKFKTKYGAGCSFSLAVARKHKNSDGSKLTDFFKLVAFDRVGEHIVKYAANSEFLGVVGELRNNFYSVNGQRVYNNFIIAESIHFYGFKKTDPDNTPPPDINAPADLNIMGGYSGDVDVDLEEIENMFSEEKKNKKDN